MRLPWLSGYAGTMRHRHVIEDDVDGVNLEFPQWRFNRLMSITEPLLWLNVESRADKALLEDTTVEILTFLEREGEAVPA